MNMDEFRPEPVNEEALKAALELFKRLDHGAQTGEWDPFLEMLHEDLTWFAPVDGFQGLHKDKASMVQLFKHHAGVTRTTWELRNVIANGNEIGCESWTHGTIQGKPYGNQLMMLFVIEDGKARHIREYAGYVNGVGAFSGIGEANDGEDAYSYKTNA
ncbi:MAG: nuclear transport factor 2 family protein [Bacteroidota bacterium]